MASLVIWCGDSGTMTVRNGSDGQRIERASTRGRRKYIPHLAEFYFRPTHDWTSEEARALFDAARNTIGPYTLDRVYYLSLIHISSPRD